MRIGNKKKDRRVVVTGLGVVSSIGIGHQKFWKNLIAGKSGISRISTFDTSKYDRHYAGEIKNFDPKQFIVGKKVSMMGRTSQLAIAASKLAIKDAGIDLRKLDRGKVGVCLGTTMGEGRVIEQIVQQSVEISELPFNNMLAIAYPASIISTNVALELRLSGREFIFANACAAGNYAIGYAFDLIRSTRMDYALAGGADALSRIAFTGFNRLFAMAPEKCQPFDKSRTGMLLGEGAGMLFIESLESAQKRKAHIYAEVLGYGLSCDAHHMTAASSHEVAKATKKALENAGIIPGDVDYVSAHGTGTKENDAAECRALKEVFGKKLKDIPISSIKSMLGHTMGAASAIEAIACCLAVENGEIPPTINFKTKDPECEIDCVPNKARKHRVETVLNNSQAFGGNNAFLILTRKY